jgi:hypothetical protein
MERIMEALTRSLEITRDPEQPLALNPRFDFSW